MKNIFFTTLIIFFALKYCVAQETDFYEGSWVTSTKDIVNANNQYYNIQTITTTPFDKDKLMIISSTIREDSVVKAFSILQDSLTWGPVLWEGGEAIIEATNTEIHQLSQQNQIDKNLYQGNWSVIQKTSPTKTFFTSNWIAYNNGSPFKLRTMIAFFKQEREFVLSVNNSTNGCDSGYIEVYINGIPIRENRQGTVAPKRFYSGASIYGKGTRISVKSFTQCTIGKGVSGSFKFKL